MLNSVLLTWWCWVADIALKSYLETQRGFLQHILWRYPGQREVTAGTSSKCNNPRKGRRGEPTSQSCALASICTLCHVCPRVMCEYTNQLDWKISWSKLWFFPDLIILQTFMLGLCAPFSFKKWWVFKVCVKVTWFSVCQAVCTWHTPAWWFLSSSFLSFFLPSFLLL